MHPKILFSQGKINHPTYTFVDLAGQAQSILWDPGIIHLWICSMNRLMLVFEDIEMTTVIQLQILMADKIFSLKYKLKFEASYTIY